MNKIVLSTLVSLLLTVSSSFAEAAPTKEVLHGFELTQKELVLKVKSTGCTYNESFSIAVNDRSSGKLGPATELTVYRVQPDRCRARPIIVDVRFSRKSIGLNSVEGPRALVLRNLFRMPRN